MSVAVKACTWTGVCLLSVALALVTGPVAADTYRGVVVAPEHRCSHYDADDYDYPQSVEDVVIARQGGIFSPYTGRCFGSKRETDIEHIVARSEAHDSGLCAAGAATRRAFASDPLNLTLAAPRLNRREKVAKDVADWLPRYNACWFVATALEVRRKYGLTIDMREVGAAERVLARCTAHAMRVPDCRNVSPPPARSPASAVPWDHNGDGRVTCAEARAAGIAPVGEGHPAYALMYDADGDGVVCE